MTPLQQLYDRTKNPIYLWQAIAEAPAIPHWCVKYLRQVARNLTRRPKNIAAALSFSRQGQRNVYARREIDRRDMKFATQFFFLNYAYSVRKHLPKGFSYPTDARHLVLRAIETKCGVKHDRAQRILAHGISLHKTAKLRGEVSAQLSVRHSGSLRSTTRKRGAKNGKVKKVAAGKNTKGTLPISAVGT